jgi:ATP-dependent helicase/nuclease subunit B
LRRPAIDDIEQLLEAVEVSEELEIKEWFGKLWKPLSTLYDFRNKEVQFADLVNVHVDVINTLSDDLWGGEDGFAMSEFFREVIASANNLGIIESEYYPDLMRQLLEPAKFFPKVVSNIVAINPRDASLLDYDRVIIADCNEDSLPRARNVDPWMNDKMRVELGLSSAHEAIGASHYSFLLLLSKKEVYLTRSTISKSKHNIESRFISDLLLSMNAGGLSPRYDWKSFIKNKFTVLNRQETPMSIGQASDFVHDLSVTNIELLMRNPYGFYAKKILGLKSLDNIACEVSMADFGTLIHNIIALYTENYDPNIIDKYQYMLHIGKGVFDQFYAHKKSRIWWQKFITIAQSFVEWDEARREELASVYSEIYGEMKLNILGRNIKVTAIADRIEVTKAGEVRILDYKTGTVPTKQDVMSGLSPQLMIEAMIASGGGFKGVPSVVPGKITYVKITNIKHQASSETSFDISEEDLERHKNGMIKLLEHYVSSPVFLSDPNVKHAVRYNDYKNLVRGYKPLIVAINFFCSFYIISLAE